MYKKLKKPILFILGALLLFLLFSQTTLGKRVLLEANVIEAIRNFFAGNPELHACDYKDGTILLIKPLATGVGEGRYEAGDIIEIKDGIALCERFGNGDFLGRKEKTRALVVYYPAKLTDEQKRELVESEYETDTEVRLQDPKEVGLQRENGEAPLKLLKRRQVGVDYTKFLNDNEVLKIRSFEGLNRIPEIDLSPIIEKSPDQKSVVQIPKHLARIENFRDGINKIVRKIIPFAFAQTGGTNTICTSGCDYTTLNDWEGLEQGILTSPAIAQITEGFQDTTAVTILGWDTTASNYIYIYTTPAARHSGKWDVGKYRLELTMTSAYSNLLVISEEYVRIDGIQIKGSTGAGVTVLRELIIGIDNVNSDIRISNNIIKIGTIASGYPEGMILGNYNASFNYSVWNNIVYDPTHTASGSGITIRGGTGTKNSYIYNNTVVNWSNGITGANTTAINNIVKGSGDTNAYINTSSGSDYNSTDGTDATDGGANSLRSQTFTFVSEGVGTEDYHLQSTDTGALNNGNGATPKGLFTDDIDG